MKVAFFTLGCKVNQYESQAMSELLAKHGFITVPDCEKADVYVINSCTVTAFGDKKTRQAVRRFKKNNPDSCIVLTGCMPQAYPDKAKELLEADIVIGNKNNDTLYDKINEFFSNKTRCIDIIPHMTGDTFRGNTITGFDRRTRAFLKIQDGCNRFCSYCIIPASRGRVRSKPIEEIKNEIECLAKNGYKEVVLVGINLSSYGSDMGESFAKAVETVCETKGIERVRLGSLEPDHITDEVIERLSKLKKLCPQFHISLQSGCNETLKRMNRHYTAEEYKILCDKLRKSFPDCTLTTDVMVGFSLESEDEFNESLDFVKKIRFEKVHVFPYSVRKGTKAEKLPQIEKHIKDERSAIMIRETEKIRKEFLESQIGKTYEVLIETNKIGDMYEGYTENYIPVLVKCDEKYTSEIVKVKIVSAENDNCIGEII